MSDYIKREDAKQLFLNHMGNEFPQSIKEQIVEKAFEELPLSADVVEVRHGHWKVVSDGYGDKAYICECSECKDTVWVYKDSDREWNYCPNCGARMDGEEQENE